MINLGSLGITDIKIGTSSVLSGYVGTSLVYPVYRDCGCIYGEGTANQRIVLPIKTSGTLKYRFRGQVLKATGGILIGGVYGSDNDDYRFFTQNNLIYLDMGASRVSAARPFNYEEDIDITVGNLYMYDNIGGTYWLSGATASNVPDRNALTFNLPFVKMYSLQVWETSGGTDVLIYDGIPKVRISDGEEGMLDRVSGIFNTNATATIYTCY